MKTVGSANAVLQRNHLVGIVVGTAVLLAVPLVAMRFSEDVNWSVGDFVVAGALLLGAGITGDLIITKAHGTARKLISLALVLAAFLYVWAELAVGIFTHLGS